MKFSLREIPSVNVLSARRLLIILYNFSQSWWDHNSQDTRIVEQFARFFFRENEMINTWNPSPKELNNVYQTVDFMILHCQTIFSEGTKLSPSMTEVLVKKDREQAFGLITPQRSPSVKSELSDLRSSGGTYAKQGRSPENQPEKSPEIPGSPGSPGTPGKRKLRLKKRMTML